MGLTLQWYLALDARVSKPSGRTAAHGTVVNHRTDRIQTARSRTDVPTVLMHASLVAWAVRVDNALGVSTRRGAVDDATHAVLTAW